MDAPLPYKQLNSVPENYSAGTVAARFVDGLGFRYYWATEGLTANDMDTKGTDEARTVYETMVHILQLTEMMKRSVQMSSTSLPVAQGAPFEELRSRTLLNIKSVSDILMSAKDKDLENFTVLAGKGEGASSVPFWFQMNGPIEDAVWHAGQIVALRRMAGNPISNKINFFKAEVRE